MLKKAYLAWLEPENFNRNGQQKTKLADLIAASRREAMPER